MYASNEDEFNDHVDDWVFFDYQPELKITVDGLGNLVDYESSNSNSSSSSSSNSGSLKSNRSDSLSSLSVIEHEHVQDDDRMVDQECHLFANDPVLVSTNNVNNNKFSLVDDVKENISSSQNIIQQNNHNESIPIFNEYDLFNNPCDSSHESISLSNDLRRRTGANIQHTEIAEQYSPPAELELVPFTTPYRCQRRRQRNYVLFIYGLLILFLALYLLIGQFVSSQQLEIYKITEELEKTNRRLEELKQAPVEDVVQKLTQQFEDKVQMLINQKMVKYNQEKYSLSSQIDELHQIINSTKQNFNNIIQTLLNDNERLKDQVTTLERRLKPNNEQSSKENESCHERGDCEKASTSSFDMFVENLIQQTASITENTSANVFGVLEQLSTSLSDIVAYPQEYIIQSKKILSSLSASKTIKQVQNRLLRDVENFSTALNNVQSTYSTWVRSRAQHREQARKDNARQEQKVVRHPWRWTFERSHTREQMRHQS